MTTGADNVHHVDCSGSLGGGQNSNGNTTSSAYWQKFSSGNVEGQIDNLAAVTGLGLTLETDAGALDFVNNGSVAFNIAGGPPLYSLQLDATGGDITYSGSGIVTGQNGVEATSTFGNITIGGTGTIEGTNGDALNATAIGGNILIEGVDVKGYLSAFSTGFIGVTAKLDGGYGANANIVVVAPGGTIDKIGTDGVSVSNDGTNFINVSNFQAINNTSGDGIKTSMTAAGTAVTSIDVEADVTGSANGINSTSQGGAVNVGIGSWATVTGNGGPGVQISTGGGNASITGDDTGSVIGSGTGAVVNTSDPLSLGGGTITIDGLAVVQGNNGDGIHASSASSIGNGAGQINISNVGTILGTGGNGINANSGAGIDIEASGLDGGITGTHGDGINASTGFSSDDIIINANGDISGSNRGIVANAFNGGGNMSITDNGNISGQSGNGVEVSLNRSADAKIDGNGDIRGGAAGVFVLAGSGTVSVSGNGDITGITGAGVEVSSPGNVASTIANNGAISGTSGVVISGTDLNVLGNRSITGKNGIGVSAFSTQSGDVDVSGNGRIIGDGTGFGDAAIVASAGTGNVQVDHNGRILGAAEGVSASTNSGNVSVSGNGRITANGTGIFDDGVAATSHTGDVTVNRNGRITAATTGVSVGTTTGNVTVSRNGTIISNGTTIGDVGVSASVMGTGNVNVGRNGRIVSALTGVRASANTGDVVVSRNGSITGNGTGFGDAGVFATVQGAGNAIVDQNGHITGGTGVEASTFSGDVSVSHNDSITGNGSAIGDAGVFADTQGAGSITVDGNGRIVSAATGVTASSGSGDVSVSGNARIIGNGTGPGQVGVAASSGGTGNVSVNDNGRIVGATGVQANAASGDISVSNNRRITGNGTGSGNAGVLANSQGASDVSVDGNGRITGAKAGVRATSGSGNVSVSNNLRVTGNGDVGIMASTGRNGTVDVDDNGNVTGSTNGITANTTSGALSITGNRNIQGGTNGIVATSIGAAISIDGNGGISGELGEGISANSNGGAIDIGSVTGNGPINGATDGINTNSGAGKTTITIGNTITGGQAAILARATTGDIEVALNADTTSVGGVGTDLQTTTGNILLTNAATLSGGKAAITGNTAGGDYDISNKGTINGLVNVTAGSASSLFDNTGGVWNAFGGSSSYNRDFLAGANSAINMINGSTTDVVNIGGTYTGTAASALTIDLNAAKGQADKLATGDAVGTTTVNFAKLADGFVTAPIVVVSQSSDNDRSEQFVKGSGLTNDGIIAYQFGKQGSNWVVSSAIDPAGGASIVTNVTAALATLESSFYQPASKSVDYHRSSPNEISCGLWFRGDGGQYDIGATSALSVNGGGSLGNIGARQRLNYTGGQVGFDCGALNINGSGWNAHIGPTGGDIQGNITELNGQGRDELDIPFVGGYAFLTNGALTFDASVHHDFNNLKINNQLAGLDKTDVDGGATTVNGSVVYHANLGGGLFVSPSAGISYTRFDLDTFRILSGTVPGSVSTGSDESLMGNIGIEVSFVQRISPTSYVIPYASVSAWKNFDSSTNLNLTFDDVGSGATTIRSNTTDPTSFGEYTGGLSYANTKLGVTAYVEGTWREGSDISGSSVTGGGRISF